MDDKDLLDKFNVGSTKSTRGSINAAAKRREFAMEGKRDSAFAMYSKGDEFSLYNKGEEFSLYAKGDENGSSLATVKASNKSIPTVPYDDDDDDRGFGLDDSQMDLDDSASDDILNWINFGKCSSGKSRRKLEKM